MAKQRPINLNLFTISFPLPAIASILHRISGAILFFLIPFILWIFDDSLASEGHFATIKTLLANPVFKLAIWAFLIALLYHLLAGIRHLLMDMGIGESLKAGRLSAFLVVLLTIILTIVTGLWLWLII